MILEERALLGGVLYEDRENIPRTVWDILPQHFETWEHQQIWIAIRVVLDKGMDPEPLSVSLMLGNQGLKELVSGLESEAGSRMNLPAYAQGVLSAGLAREGQRKIKQALARAEECGTVDELREAVRDSGALESGPGGPTPIGDIVPTVVEEIERRKTDPDAFRLCRTGLQDLDRHVEMRDSQLTVLAARPGMGKSALACNIALYAANRKWVVIYSLEMSQSQLVGRMLLSDDCKAKRMFIDDRAGLTVEQIRSSLMQIDDPTLVIVDYLQLIQVSQKFERNDLRVGSITKGLKNISKDFRCHVIALAQLNRQVEGRNDHRPLLSDLRDSGNIEEDADNVWFIHRPGYYDTAAGNGAEIIMAKNRHGPTGLVRVMWDGKRQKFEEA